METIKQIWRWPVPFERDGQVHVAMVPSEFTMQTRDSKDGFVTTFTLSYPVARQMKQDAKEGKQPQT